MHPAALQEFLDYAVRQLIDHPEEMVLVKSEAESSDRRSVFKLRLRQSDVGKVIGKHGHTIIAIRNLLTTAAARHGHKAVLDLVEEEGAAVGA